MFLLLAELINLFWATFTDAWTSLQIFHTVDYRRKLGISSAWRIVLYCVGSVMWSSTQPVHTYPPTSVFWSPAYKLLFSTILPAAATRTAAAVMVTATVPGATPPLDLWLQLVRLSIRSFKQPHQVMLRRRVWGHHGLGMRFLVVLKSIGATNCQSLVLRIKQGEGKLHFSLSLSQKIKLCYHFDLHALKEFVSALLLFCLGKISTRVY